MINYQFYYNFSKRKYFRYIGDFSEEDLETPRRRKLFWSTHIKMLDEKNQKIKLLEQKNRRLESKISSLNTLVDKLKKDCQLNASYTHILKVINDLFTILPYKINKSEKFIKKTKSILQKMHSSTTQCLEGTSSITGGFLFKELHVEHIPFDRKRTRK